MMRMDLPPKEPERRIRRYDLRELAVFQRLIAAQPRLALVLAALLALAGVALAAGWVPTPRPTARSPWIVAVLAWLLALVVAVIALRGLRPGTPKQD